LATACSYFVVGPTNKGEPANFRLKFYISVLLITPENLPMAIHVIAGYISKETAAQQYKVQVRTINDWIRKTSPAPDSFSFIRVDGFEFIKDRLAIPVVPAGIVFGQLEWLKRFAKRNTMNWERVYEQIFKGNISGVMIGDRVFIIKSEPQVLDYGANYKRKRKVASYFRR
jgi:hypothetical protein